MTPSEDRLLRAAVAFVETEEVDDSVDFAAREAAKKGDWSLAAAIGEKYSAANLELRSAVAQYKEQH